MSSAELAVYEKAAMRLQSDLSSDPMTGAMLGMDGMNALNGKDAGSTASSSSASGGSRLLIDPQAAKQNAMVQAEAGAKEPPVSRS